MSDSSTRPRITLAQYAILSLIERGTGSGPAYGAWICAQLEGLQLGRPPATVYAFLTRLQKRKLVASHQEDPAEHKRRTSGASGGRRQFYRLTPLGAGLLESSRPAMEALG